MGTCMFPACVSAIPFECSCTDRNNPSKHNSCDRLATNEGSRKESEVQGNEPSNRSLPLAWTCQQILFSNRYRDEYTVQGVTSRVQGRVQYVLHRSPRGNSHLQSVYRG